MSRPRNTWITSPGRVLATLIVAGLAVSSLVGCGGASSVGTAGASGGTTIAAASKAASAGGSSGRKAAFTDAEACAWAKQELLALKKVKDPINVQFNILGSLSDLFDKHGGLENAGLSGYDVDAATKRACPTEHDQLLKKAQIKSLGNL
jgi:hypothetical protein